MARQGINTGSAPDAGDGDSLLIGALKINANFSEIYTTLGDGNNITNSIGFASTSGISTYSNLSRVVIKDSGSTVGTAGTIDFGNNLTVSAISAGIVTVTATSSSDSQWQSTTAGIHTLSNVGIGTTNPTSKLTVKGNTSLETLNVSGITTLAGITTVTGETLFAKQLNVSGVSTVQHLLVGSQSLTENNDNTVIIGLGIASSNGGGNIDVVNDDLQLAANGTIFGSRGNIIFYKKESGLNKSEIATLYSDTGNLSIDGNITANGDEDNIFNSTIKVGTGGTVITTTAAGLVGIGTTNPQYKLDINGSTRVGVNTSAGVILTSPNGTKYQLFVEDDGTLKTVAV